MWHLIKVMGAGVYGVETMGGMGSGLAKGVVLYDSK